MTSLELGRRRLVTQRVMGPRSGTAAEVVRRLGAVQAQDYLGALWGIGLRTRTPSEAAVERAIAERTIVRTWPMRGTLHFVPAADVRWMLELLAPRALAQSAPRLRQLGLGDAALARSRSLVARALSGGTRLTRAALYDVLREGGVAPDGQRGIHVLGRLAQERLVCLATREGRQQTFALLDEWIPPARRLERDEALAELAARYFTGHGPATLDDFAWWSGLAAADAREALALARPRLVREGVDGRELWSGGAARARGDAARGARLLPPFDELLVGYRDRSASLAPVHAPRLHGLLSPTIVLDGRIAGTWTRSSARESVVVKASLFERAGGSRRRALEAAVREYGAFVGRRAALAPSGAAAPPARAARARASREP